MALGDLFQGSIWELAEDGLAQQWWPWMLFCEQVPGLWRAALSVSLAWKQSSCIFVSFSEAEPQGGG